MVIRMFKKLLFGYIWAVLFNQLVYVIIIIFWIQAYCVEIIHQMWIPLSSDGHPIYCQPHKTASSIWPFSPIQQTSCPNTVSYKSFKGWAGCGWWLCKYAWPCSCPNDASVSANYHFVSGQFARLLNYSLSHSMASHRTAVMVVAMVTGSDHPISTPTDTLTRIDTHYWPDDVQLKTVMDIH